MGLIATLHEITHRDFSRPILLLVASIGVLALLRSKRVAAERNPDEVLLAIAVGGAATALVAPIFWLHYGVLVAPAALVSWRLAPERSRGVTLLALLLMSSVPRMLDGDLERFAVGVALAQVVLFALSLIAWTRARRGLLA
jgi:hypothetical protein